MKNYKSKPSKLDPELNYESSGIVAEYPYAVARDETNPIFSRIRTNVRTKDTFPVLNKLEVKKVEKGIQNLSLED